MDGMGAMTMTREAWQYDRGIAAGFRTAAGELEQTL